MCGIHGWLGHDHHGSLETLRREGALLAHRGPDGQGEDIGPLWGLGFRRLAILDLSSAGNQPMKTPDGRYRLVFNGEVYNYLELRAELERRGVRLRGGSDSEVLLWLLALDGVGAVERLNGMFAFAFLDIQDRSFVLGRDRLGKKPLYYGLVGKALRFASELKVLLASPAGRRPVSAAAVAQYLALAYLPSETCIVEGYHKLMPGHVLTGGLDEPSAATQRRYWDLSPGRVGSEDAPLLPLLRDAVGLRLRSDVPVGVFLSGGLDSGVVASLAAEQAREAGVTPPLALTVGFDDREYDESHRAAVTAAAVGLEHVVVHQRASALEDLDRLTWHYDEPFADPSALPTYALSEAAAQHGTVFLTGDGGDEAFGGYRRYIESLRYGWLGRVPAPAAAVARAAARAMPASSAMRHRVVKATAVDSGFAAAFDRSPDDALVAAVMHEDLSSVATHAGDPLWSRWAQWRDRDLTTRQRMLDYALYLPDDILVKVDRASMAHSLEVRSPFLDFRVVEWGAHQPTERLIRDGYGKLPLREIAVQRLPAEVLASPKQGFGVPLDAWFREPAGHTIARDRLLSSQNRHRGWWDARAVEQLLQDHKERRGRPAGELIWRLLVLEAWGRHYDTTWASAANTAPLPSGAA